MTARASARLARAVAFCLVPLSKVADIAKRTGRGRHHHGRAPHCRSHRAADDRRYMDGRTSRRFLPLACKTDTLT